MFCFLNFHDVTYHSVKQSENTLFVKKCRSCKRVWWLQSTEVRGGKLHNEIWADLGPNAQIGGVWNEVESSAAMIRAIELRED